MPGPAEVLLTSDTDNALWAWSAWDPHTGAGVASYRGAGGTGAGAGGAAPRTLRLLGTQHAVAAERTRPLLQVWPLNSQQPVPGLRLVLPGRATALAASPDGRYLVAGVADKLYLWQVASGSLLTIISRHYRPVTVLEFAADGRFFASAAEDGTVMVWSLATVAAHPEVELATQSSAGRHDPLCVFSAHSLPVTALAFGKTGVTGRLASVSSDRTCKIYNLANGETLLNLVFDVPLLSIVFDTLELNIFVGTMEGKIIQFALTNPPRTREHYITDDKGTMIFTGHTKGVTCLSVSLDGETLASGSNDERVILWHIPSKQQIRTLGHKGSVTNAFFTLNPKAMHLQDFTSSIVLHSLDRTLEKDNDSVVEVEVLNKTKTNFWPTLDTNQEAPQYLSEEFKKKETKLRDEIQTLKKINAELYAFSTQKVIDNGVQSSVHDVTSINKKIKRK